MSNDVHITARQLWGQLTSSAVATATATGVWCTPLILPSGGVLVFDDNNTSTISARVTFKIPCANREPIISPDTTGNSTVIGFQDPFYASISPQIYALAAATVISYVLVILIFINPRTFVGSTGSGGRFLTRRGVISSSSPIVGIGRRPLLQKIATITVAASLTIATADTFRVAQDQYNQGYMDSSLLVNDVVNSLEIRIILVISDTFLWLAQVQTLIRLFPRHKEKVTIKWLGFVLVSFDTIFSILDSIVSENTRTRARSFTDAIPALNYLFELAISLIYASCVVYYSLSKRRFAFYHTKMRNICLVALISLMSVLIPVVFFVLDIAKPNVAGWGVYIRWVGATAASVVVWEWVERIEALEREERKDGILGREIFDGDEMLDMTPSEEADWHGRRRVDDGGDDAEKSAGFGGITARYNRIRARIPRRKQKKGLTNDRIVTGENSADSNVDGAILGENQPIPPPPAITPPSRSDTNSAASTVYAIRYHNLTSPSPAIPEVPQEPEPPIAEGELPKEISDSSTESAPSAAEKENIPQGQEKGPNVSATRPIWQSMPNPFKRRRAEPPAEVAGAQIASGMRRSPIDRAINLRGRFGAFTTAQKGRFASRSSIQGSPLPVMIIPAPRMNERTWSPDDVRDFPGDSASTERTSPFQRASEPTRYNGSNLPENVVVIPAPTPGRTWSPGDAYAPESPGPGQSPTNPSPPAQRPSPPQQTQVVYTPRGSLIISETAKVQTSTQSPTGSRQATHPRPLSISPISERLGMESPSNESNQEAAAVAAATLDNDPTRPTTLQTAAPASRDATAGSSVPTNASGPKVANEILPSDGDSRDADGGGPS